MTSRPAERVAHPHEMRLEPALEAALRERSQLAERERTQNNAGRSGRAPRRSLRR